MEELVKLFESIGLDTNKATETAKNKKLSVSLREVIEEVSVPTGGVDRSKGILLYSLASLLPTGHAHRGYIAKRILDGSLRTDDQVQAAVAYVKQNGIDGSFDEACGVGVKVSEEQMSEAAMAVMASHQEALVVQRYAYPFTTIFRDAKDRPDMRWADRRRLKQLVDEAILVTLGPKTVADEEAEAAAAMAGKKKGSAAPANAIKQVSDERAQLLARFSQGEAAFFHRPGENPQLRPEIMEAHLKATGGKVVTRFPPEPNGFLHIGHAKAINFNFNYAKAHDGICYLRFDDTNPEAEETLYYESIRKDVEWLGFKPYRETAASDNFQILYEFAVELIKRGKAYVCHQTAEEMCLSRGGEDGKGPRVPSPWRDRPMEENLREFERMRKGEYGEGEAVLRLKMDLNSPNPCLWDLVAYRVLKTPHCRTGSEWNIYPMYDYTHCLCDSLENITHSLCTTEFIIRRDAYYWVCDALEVYKPVQWEYGRLNITNTVLSKRKLTKLVELGHVRSWDDPRMYTIAALRRRGVTPAAINRFVEELGITTASAVVDVRRFEQCVRDDLNRTVLRRMAILDPVTLCIDNYDGDNSVITIPNDPRDPSKGESQLTLTPHVLIDRSDWRHGPSDPNFFRLCLDQPVGLYQVGVFTATRVDDAGMIHGTLDRRSDASKPKTFIQWLPSNAPKAEVRLYRPLFKSMNPDDAEGGFLADLTPNSLEVIENAHIDPRIPPTVPIGTGFQFQRVGYFCVDPDSRPDCLVFNLTVSIKEDPLKN